MAAVNELRGSLEGKGLRFALLVSRFNEVVTDSLLEGAVEALTEHGVDPADLTVVRVPGAWELPGTAVRILDRGQVDAVVTLGCVIRGETPHFRFVAGEAARGLGTLARTAPVPVVFGVLTTDDLEQALRRAGEGPDNKGREAALSALEMANLYRALS